MPLSPFKPVTIWLKIAQEAQKFSKVLLKTECVISVVITRRWAFFGFLVSFGLTLFLLLWL